MTDGELPRFCRKKLNCVITNSGTGCAADRADHHREKSTDCRTYPGRSMPAEHPVSRDAKIKGREASDTEPEEEEFVVNGIYALVIGYEVLVKQ